jgi:hypothetical protein
MKLSTSPYYELRAALQNNPIQLAREIIPKNEDSFNYTMAKVNSGGWIAIEIEETLLEVGARGLCDLVYVDVSVDFYKIISGQFQTDFPPQPKAVIMKKGHPLLSEINRVIVEDAVYFRRIYNRYLRDARPSKCEPNFNKPKALGKFLHYEITLTTKNFRTGTLLRRFHNSSCRLSFGINRFSC